MFNQQYVAQLCPSLEPMTAMSKDKQDSDSTESVNISSPLYLLSTKRIDFLT